MFRIVLIIFIFFKSNVYAEDIKCNFEEIYNDGSIQEGYILLKNDKLRYQYQDENFLQYFLIVITFIVSIIAIKAQLIKLLKMLKYSKK